MQRAICGSWLPSRICSSSVCEKERQERWSRVQKVKDPKKRQLP